MLLLAGLVLIPATPSAEEPTVVDEVVAVVDDTPILLSDLRLAWAVRLVEPRPGEGVEELGRRLADARIALEIQYADLGIQRRDTRTEPRTETVLQRLFEAGGGRQPLVAVLARWGLDGTDVRELAARLAAVEAYIESELGPEIRPSLEDARAVYEQEIVPETRRSGHEPPPFESMIGELSRLVRERQLNRRLEDWLADARGRHTVLRYRDWAPAELEPSAP